MDDIRWFYTSPDLAYMPVAHDGLNSNMGVKFHVSQSPKAGFALTVTLRPPGNPERVVATWLHHMTDPILAWRAALIGEKAKHLNYSLLPIFVAAADRTNETFQKRYVEELISEIGLGTYQTLNRTPVPEYMIDLLVHTIIDDLLTRPKARWTDALDRIEKEAMNVTLKWRDAFFDFGLINPRNFTRRSAADAVAERYQEPLKALNADFGFKFSGVDPHRLLRQLLLRAEEKQLHILHGPDLAFGMALHLLRGATHDSLTGVSHWLPGRFEARPQFATGRVKYYQDRLESLTYEWFGRTK